MNYEGVMKELREMRSHFDSGFSIMERTRIVELYKVVLNKTFDDYRLACENCYRDAFLEIFTELQRKGALPEVRNYKLKKGMCLHIFGSSEYLFEVSDLQAEKYLAQFPENIDYFEEYPEDWNDRAQRRKKTLANRKSAMAKKAAQKAVEESNRESE